jgi:hypothetical protein
MADDTDARLARLEARIDQLERKIFLFQAMVAKKMAQALTLIRGRQQTRDHKVADALQKLASELGEVRDRLGVLRRPKVTH